MPLKRCWHAELALLPSGVASHVLIEADGERIGALTPNADPTADASRLPGLTIPGLANAHSHAFHRALRGRTQRDGGDFWTWRRRMYELAARLDPDSYRALATAVYAEMTLAGVTAVGEFQYLHHDPRGRPYADPNEMGLALSAAAAEAGIRLTLIDTCYLRGDIKGRPLEGPQVRFGDGDASAWADRVGKLQAGPALRIAAGIHSVRTLHPGAMRLVAAWAAERSAPLHLHLSEQRAENDDCLAASGLTPAALADRCGVLGPRTTAVHATFLGGDDIRRLGGTRTAVCLCPTTERDLGDGIGPAAALAAAGSRLCVGSDSQAVIDLFEEVRAIELDERLATGRRGHHSPAALLAAATAGGTEAIGWRDASRLEAGALADFATLDLSSPRLAGARTEDLVDHVVFAATAADVTHVVVAGRPVVEQRRHLAVEDVGQALAGAIKALEWGDRGAAGVALQRVRRLVLADVVADFAGDPGGKGVTQAREAQVDRAARDRVLGAFFAPAAGLAGGAGPQQQLGHAPLPGSPLGGDGQQLGGGQADGVGLGADQVVLGGEVVCG